MMKCFSAKANYICSGLSQQLYEAAGQSVMTFFVRGVLRTLPAELHHLVYNHSFKLGTNASNLVLFLYLIGH